MFKKPKPVNQKNIGTVWYSIPLFYEELGRSTQTENLVPRGTTTIQ